MTAYSAQCQCMARTIVCVVKSYRFHIYSTAYLYIYSIRAFEDSKFFDVASLIDAPVEIASTVSYKLLR